MKGTIRFKIINHKRRPLCDYHGNCKNLAYKEVYPNLRKEGEDPSWCYLCKKHFIQEQKRLKKLGYYDLESEFKDSLADLKIRRVKRIA